MSWTVTEHEGRVCYEQDGRRVFSTQEVDALNKLNSSPKNDELLCQRYQHNYYEEMQMDNDDMFEYFMGYEKPNKWFAIIWLIVVAIFIWYTMKHG